MQALWEDWRTEWNDYPHGRQTKQFLPGLQPSFAKKLLKLTRHEVGRLVRLVTGHNNLNYHMSLMNPGANNMCRFCNTDRETFYHFVSSCPSLLSHRVNTFLQYEGPNPEEWDPGDLLAFSRFDVIRDAIDYYDWADWSSREDDPMDSEDI